MASAFILLLIVSMSAATLQEGVFIVQGQTSNNTTVVNGTPESSISILSPENKTYNNNNITLNFVLDTNISSVPLVARPFYVVGANLDYNISNLNDIFSGVTYGYPSYPTSLPLSLTSDGGTVNLTDLSQGPHQLTVWLVVFQYMISYDGYLGSVYSTVSFNIDSIPPSISVISPENKSYDTSNVLLDFTVNKTVSQISYSLDGHQNITTSGNMTLTELSNGAHKMTVYATDETGNVGSSQTISFTVAAFPTLTVAAVSGAIAVVVAGLLIYHKTRKH